MLRVGPQGGSRKEASAGTFHRPVSRRLCPTHRVHSRWFPSANTGPGAPPPGNSWAISQHRLTSVPTLGESHSPACWPWAELQFLGGDNGHGIGLGVWLLSFQTHLWTMSFTAPGSLTLTHILYHGGVSRCLGKREAEIMTSMQCGHGCGEAGVQRALGTET